ncbi:hypothetical protein SAMD00023353_5800160 [Rosellinia necatrix]|uniref:Uncharacterized protein n=1 Tax=Rosellinia necatrix TaxID=77044 RepID=A0A1W2TS17_ROSNE|nr:hypothetical protein SAMD00023353_5800160 [Rosellinia necatrix]
MANEQEYEGELFVPQPSPATVNGQEDEPTLQQPSLAMGQNGAIQVGHAQPPAVANATGQVLASGQFQCALMDRHGAATTQMCGATMNNTVGSIKSHLSKIHRPTSNYVRSQASHAKSHGQPPLVCDRPRLNGEGWCTNELYGKHSLVAHARKAHKFKGSSVSLSTPWKDLTVGQQMYYSVRVQLERRRLENGNVYTPEDEALNTRYEQEKFPDIV